MFFIHNMNIINIVIFLVILIILILYFFQFKYFSKINEDLVILQRNNPDKELIEDMLENKSPTIFTGMIENWEVNDDKKIEKKEFDENTKIFNIPLCLAKKYKHLVLPENKKTKIVKEHSNRNILFLLEEISIFI